MDLIIDIGNGSVGVALVNAQETKPRIMYSLRELVLFDEKPSGDVLQHAILQALERVLSEVVRARTRGTQSAQNSSEKIHYRKIVCVLSSPWFVAQGKSIIISQEKPFIMSARFLQDIVVKESAQDLTQDLSHGLSQGLAHDAPNYSIESMVVGGTVNGYKLSNLVGQKTREADISLYTSRAETTFIETVSSVIRRHTTGSMEIIFHTFPFVVFSSLREIFPDTQDYIHIDVAGEITDMTVVANNMIQKMISCPVGKNSIVRNIARRFGVPGDAARALFHMCVDQRAEAAVVAGVHEALAESEKEWISFVEKGLSDDAHIFLTAYSQTADIFETFLRSWHADVTVTHIDQNLLDRFVALVPGLDPDIFLSLETFFLSRFL